LDHFEIFVTIALKGA